MTVFERTKNMAKKRGISLQETAAKAGLGLNSIYGWKKKEPSIGRLAKVADVLHVSVDYLLGKTDDPEPAQKNKPTEVDIKDAMQDDYTIMSYGGREIPPEELEMIRRILDGGK